MTKKDFADEIMKIYRGRKWRQHEVNYIYDQVYKWGWHDGYRECKRIYTCEFPMPREPERVPYEISTWLRKMDPIIATEVAHAIYDVISGY